MVYRVYVEKKEAFASQAKELTEDIRSFLRIQSLERIRILNRYDVENNDAPLFEAAKRTVFSEPQVDELYEELPPDLSAARVFATEYLPGQFDQRADSAAQCIQLISQGERPLVRTAFIYVLYGMLSREDVEAIKGYLINPVESREASLAPAATLEMQFEAPENIPILEGFRGLSAEALPGFIAQMGLAMDADDVRFCQAYFEREQRDPTLTELRVIDTYWSDHCRHTTFLTELDHVEFQHPSAQATFEAYCRLREELGVKKPVTLMDLATVGAKYLKARGKLPGLDESEEINACTVKVDVQADGETQKWLLLFKNETHNHPTEIEPFGGAATCIGGAIRDPLSGRSFVYQAMRITGAADPLRDVEQTLTGKLPQRKIVTTAAAGYSSYGNQIGLATGIVDELYHDGYLAKHMELGAVIGAAPAQNVKRLRPEPGDIILLLGGRTGRDGCGGATGSSKSHTLESLESCGAEVQKGNAPEERKLQRLFRNPAASKLIKRCNDFGAGGVAVAIGELADGLDVSLDAVPKKYDGLDGTELAISESQERMAVVLAPGDVEAFKALAHAENLEATHVATVREQPRLRMFWREKAIVDLSRDFLNSNGAPKHASAHVLPPNPIEYYWHEGSTAQRLAAIVSDLNICSKQGLGERFDSVIGAATVLMPYGGQYQRTPIQAMAAKLPVPSGDTDTCSVMAYGFSPTLLSADPYTGAYLAVVESVAKLVATGAGLKDCYLTFQEYFERLRDEPTRWGKPLSALLGALQAQLDLGFASIGGKDSMSGTFEDIDVPPTLVSFAVSMAKTGEILSPEFKQAGSRVALIEPDYLENGLPEPQSLKNTFDAVLSLMRRGLVRAAWTPGFGGVIEGIFKMCVGNRIGFAAEEMDEAAFMRHAFGGFILELEPDSTEGRTLGYTRASYDLNLTGDDISLEWLEGLWLGKLEPVYPLHPQASMETGDVTVFRHEEKRQTRASIKIAKPRVLIPVFPGTNSEYDTAAAMERAGAKAEILVVRNLTAQDVAGSAKALADALDQSQILFIPGGFSGGDEPEGSGKLITAFLRSPRIAGSIETLMERRDGLICGICNGFQALIKLGLLPYGHIRDMDASCPTLTFNTIGRHQSRLVRTRVASNKSPWLMHCQPGDLSLVPISHGEGRFVCAPELLEELARNGQIATQYVDIEGRPSMAIEANPNGSLQAIEGITSPDGRIIGKMGHNERMGAGLFRNVPGQQDVSMFKGAVDYYS